MLFAVALTRTIPVPAWIPRDERENKPPVRYTEYLSAESIAQAEGLKLSLRPYGQTEVVCRTRDAKGRTIYLPIEQIRQLNITIDEAEAAETRPIPLRPKV